MAQVTAGRDFLGAVSGNVDTDSLFEEIRMEAVTVPEWSGADGKSLGDISPARHHGVQIAGVNRGGVRILNPSGTEVLRAGDELLALGTPAQLRDFKGWLGEKPAQGLAP
jgi:CPA2 family monovalent cation:H+ antiporter-2